MVVMAHSWRIRVRQIFLGSAWIARGCKDTLHVSRREECRMPFVGPLKGACPGLCPQKARRHSFWKIRKSKAIFFFMLHI